MRIDVFTIFPDMVAGFAQQAILGRAQAAGTLDIRVHDIRDGATGVHRAVDDSPFGGGAGMVLMPEPLFAVVEAAEPAASAALPQPHRAAVRPVGGPRAGRLARLQPALRPL